MTHNRFMSFKLVNGEIFNGEINDFLKNKLGSFSIKSISLTELPSQSNEMLITFGFDFTPLFSKQYIYGIQTRNLGPYTLSTEEIAQKMEDVVNEMAGIVCQDIACVNDELIATFLVIKD